MASERRAANRVGRVDIRDKCEAIFFRLANISPQAIGGMMLKWYDLAPRVFDASFTPTDCLPCHESI